MDFHADRTAVRANQSIVDVMADKLDLPKLTQLPSIVDGGMKRSAWGSPRTLRGGTAHAGTPSRATSPSIHDSISCVNCAASLPSGEIDGPIESVIVPGFFPNNPLGHR